MNASPEKGVDQVLARELGEGKKPVPRIGREKVEQKFALVVLLLTQLGARLVRRGGLGLGDGPVRLGGFRCIWGVRHLCLTGSL